MPNARSANRFENTRSPRQPGTSPERAGHDIALAGLAVADRDLPPRLDEVKLRELTRASAGYVWDNLMRR